MAYVSPALNWEIHHTLLFVMIQVLIRSFVPMIWLLYGSVGEGRGLDSSRPSAAAIQRTPANAYEFRVNVGRRRRGAARCRSRTPYALPAREKTQKGFE
jgi:hypothetical protein